MIALIPTRIELSIELVVFVLELVIFVLELVVFVLELTTLIPRLSNEPCHLRTNAVYTCGRQPLRKSFVKIYSYYGVQTPDTRCDSRPK